jgi:isocitrate lyase
MTDDFAGAVHDGTRLRPPRPSTRDRSSAAETLRRSWEGDARWAGTVREHSAEDVLRLRGPVEVEHTLARRGAERLWTLLASRPYLPALGALTGGQAVQMVRAGLEAIYLSGWQVAADNNLDGETYPDLSLYPANSAPALVRRINKALLRAAQVEAAAPGNGHDLREWMAPIVADAEAGFGGPLNAYLLAQHFIEAGAAAIHFEDQLSSAKKCGHMGGKVVVPTAHHVRTLRAARLAADVLGVPTLLVARTDARGARLLSSDADPRDHPFLTGKRTPDGLFEVRAGLDAAIQRGLAYAPYADLLWFETNEPSLEEAERFASAIHAKFPGKWLAYNCSPSFRWSKHMDADTVADFQARLGRLGYRFQFVTLAGFHAMNAAVFDLATNYRRRGMAAYMDLQEREFALQADGYTAVKHQQEVGAGYFDEVARVITHDGGSTLALPNSTEEDQFVAPVPQIHENGKEKRKPGA